MLTVLLAFAAGVIAAFTTMRSALRRFIVREASEQRWQGIVAAAGYGAVTPVPLRSGALAPGARTSRRLRAVRAGGTSARFARRTTPAPGAPRLTLHTPVRATMGGER
jgi:hypothetical protein